MPWRRPSTRGWAFWIKLTPGAANPFEIETGNVLICPIVFVRRTDKLSADGAAKQAGEASSEVSPAVLFLPVARPAWIPTSTAGVTSQWGMHGGRPAVPTAAWQPSTMVTGVTA